MTSAAVPPPACAADLHEVAADLYGFACEIGYGDLSPGLHREIAAVVGRRHARQLILVPRGHFKTSLVTESHTLQDIRLNPSIRILIASSTLSLARSVVRNIRRHIETSPLFFDLRPAPREREKWTETELTVRRAQRRKEPTITAIGVGGTVVGQHFDLIICDDLVTPETTATREQMAKLHDWYRHAISLLDPGGRIVVVGTRYHYGDLYASLAESGAYRVYTRRAIEDGAPIFPERFTPAVLAAIRAEQGSAVFSCQYLNDPIDDESALFKRPQVVTCPRSAVPPGATIVTTIDPAVSEGPDSDYRVLTTCAHDAAGQMYVIEIRRGRWNPADLIEQMFHVAATWKPVSMKIEEDQVERTLRPFLRAEQQRRGVWLPIRGLKRDTRQSKWQRILALQPRFETGRIVFVEGCAGPQWPEIVDEITRYPKAPHDDVLDTLADQEQFAYLPQVPEPARRVKDRWAEDDARSASWMAA